jgi:tetrahydromethanopterin S-methyltransferase subunit G
MSIPSVEQLTNPEYVNGLTGLALDEVRKRRSLCQSAEEVLSFRRRMVQGRLDIVQAELYRRAGNGTAEDVASLVASLPEILVERGDRHLGPGRLTSLGDDSANLGEDYETFEGTLDRVFDGAKLATLAEIDENQLRNVAEQLDELERSISGERHALHKHIDKFQEEIVRRYKAGEASVEGLLNS